MRWLDRYRLRLRSLLLRARVDEELDEELQFYLDHTTERYIASGLSKSDARVAARRSLGSVVHVKEAVRETRGLRLLDDLVQDLNYAIRALARNRAFSIVVVVTLALGVGANTAVFSLVNTVLLRPLPVGDPEQLTVLAGSGPNSLTTTWNYRVWDEIRQRPQLVGGALAYFPSPFNLAAGGEREMVDGLLASGSFFDILKVSARLGRTFTTADDQRGGDPAGPVVVISYGLWQRRFAGADDVVGRTLLINRVGFAIVGVLPRGFTGPLVGRASDIVVPFGAAPLIGHGALLTNAGVRGLTILARRKSGQTVDAATTMVRQVQPEIREGSLQSGRENAVSQVLKHPLTWLPAARGNPLNSLRVESERPLWTLFAIVAVVLLIACGNVANLMLARALTRRHEMSVRVALGASRWRLVRQLLVESSVMTTLGAAGGLLLAQWGTAVLAQAWSNSPGAPDAVVLDLSPDARVLLFTAGLAIVTALLVGTLPALRASRVDPVDALNGRQPNGSRSGLASGLLIAQVAGSLVLVVGAGLLVRTFANLVTKDLGFDARGVLVVDVSAAGLRIAPANRLKMFESIQQAVAAVPGVEGAALADLTPVTNDAMVGPLEVSGGVPLEKGQEDTSFNRVTPGWLSVYKIPLLRGRDFTEADRPGSRGVAIVNAAFARRFLNGGDPIGHVVRNAGSPAGSMDWEIVGMTADAVYDSLRVEVPPTMYLQFFQLEPDLMEAMAPTDSHLSIRSAIGPPAALTHSVAAAIAQVNPQVALSFQPLPDVVNRSIARERGLAMLSAFFGALALALAGIGLYGVTAYAVNRRRAEIGIRMALGASSRGIVRLVFARVSLLVGTGILIGTALSVWLSRFLAPLLYGLQSDDVPTLLAGIVTLAVVGAVAGGLPANRASHLDPMEVLRDS